MTDTLLPTRPIGRSDLTVAPVGIGTWAIGGPHWRNGDPLGWGEVDDAESTAAVQAALAAGVTLVDTADVYGTGHSERLLAPIVAGRRDVVVVTKFGYTYDEATRQSPGTDASPQYVGSLLYLAIPGSVIGFTAYLTLVGRMGPERAAYCTVLFPVVALNVSAFAEGYQWSLPALAGLGLVMAGNVLVFRKPRPVLQPARA